MDLNHLITTKQSTITQLLVIALFIVTPVNTLLAREMTKNVTLLSKITNKSYQLSIYVPEQPAPFTGYPIIYLLDGHLTFPIAKKMTENLIQQKKIKPIILVGIDYKESNQWISLRAQDYTPPHNTLATDDPLIKGEKDGGNAMNFQTFINTELKPFIERRYPINQQQQALFGHSYGGLFTLYNCFIKPTSFQYYYAASPSIWWDNKVIIQNAQQFTQQSPTPLTKPQLIISVGGLEQTAPKTSLEARKQKLIKRRQVDNARDLAEFLQVSAPSKLLTEFILFPNKNHGSVIPLAIEQALIHFFQETN